MSEYPKRERIRNLLPEPEPAPKLPRGRTRRSRATYRLAVGSVFCALAAVLLGIGALIELLDMAAAVLAAVVLLPAFWRYGSGFALTTWIVTSVLSLILMAHSLSPWLFFCLLGYYPVLKKQIDRLPRPAALAVKLCVAAAAMAFYMFLFWLIMLQGSASFRDTFIAAFGDPTGTFGASLAWIFIALCLVTFFAFDLLIDKVKFIYCVRWEKKAEKWLK